MAVLRCLLRPSRETRQGAADVGRAFLPVLLAFPFIASLAHAEEKKLDDNTRNFLRNGSFEVGWCREVGRQTRPNDSRFVDETWITDEAAYHGRYSLKLVSVKPWYGQGIGLRCFTIPVSLPVGPLYTVSLWARAIQGESQVQVRVCHPHTMGTPDNPGIKPHPVKQGAARAAVTDSQWTQVKVTVPGTGGKSVYLEISGPNLYLDAIEILRGEALKPGASALEQEAKTGEEDPFEAGEEDLFAEDEDEGGAADRFTPAAWVEVGITGSQPGRIHYQGEPLRFAARLFNYAGAAREAVLVHECVNQSGQVVSSGELDPVRLEPGERGTVALALPDLGNGKYSLKYWAKGGEAAWGEHVFDIVPAPIPGKRAPTGLLAYLTPDVVALMKRAGLSYYATLCDNIRLRENYNLETGELTDLSCIAKWGADADLMMFMAINPAWWTRKAPQHWNDSMPSRHPSPPPDPETYEDALVKCAKLYGPYFKHWWIQDELEGHWHPHELLPVLDRTVEIIRKHRPDAEFFISAMGSWIDQFARLGGLENVDWIGGSVMGHGGNRGRKLGWLAARHSLGVYADAGGFTNFRPFSRLRGGKVHASWRLHNCVINSFFLHRAQGTSMYRAAPNAYDWGMVHDPYNVLEADGSMSCGLTLYAIAGLILAGSEPATDPLETEHGHGNYVWAFKDGRTGQPAVCFFPGRKRTVTLSLGADQVRLRDRLGNPVEVPVSTDGKTRLELDRQHYFLYGIGLEADAFQDAVRNAVVEGPAELAPTEETFAFCVPDDEKIVRVKVVKVDRRKAGPPQVGSEVLDSQFPYIEGFPLRPQRIPREKSLAQPWVWLSTARRVGDAPSIDGSLREWQPEISSAITLSDHVLAQIDHGQIHAFRDTFRVSWDVGMDYRVEWFAGYDDERLYFCARVFDDELVAADRPEAGDAPDRLELRFDGDLAGDLVEPSENDDLVVWLTPDRGGKTLRVETPGEGKELRKLDGAEGALAIWDDPEMLKGWAPWKHPGPHVGYLIEASIPWTALRLQPKEGMIFGFDVFAHETDTADGRLETSVLRWAGGAKPTGQLRLGGSRPTVVD